VVLYLPEPGYEDAPVGDDLMEWLNIHFIEPSTEEGDQLSALDCPWEDESFWPYLTRFVLRDNLPHVRLTHFQNHLARTVEGLRLLLEHPFTTSV